jgi:recombination protein RecR
MDTVMHYPPYLIKLMESLRKLPGVGSKSAERFAFHLLTWDHRDLNRFGTLLNDIPVQLKMCDECGCLLSGEHCLLCSDERQSHILCVVAHVRDVYAVESTREYKGLYHVLGGVISPMEGTGPEQLTIKKLLERIQKQNIRELIIALDATIEGDATALYLKKLLTEYPLAISRLAFGIPMGSSIDYVDGGTLARAFAGRSQF